MFLATPKNLFLCEFHGHLEQNLAENWKQLVSQETFRVKAALQQLNFVFKLHEPIYYFQNLSNSRLRARKMFHVCPKSPYCREIFVFNDLFDNLVLIK